MTVVHDPVAQKFSVSVDGRESFLSYSLTDKTAELYSTFVDPVDRGKGIAEKLTVAALEFARVGGLRVVPSCSYVERYIQRHKEYAELL